MVNRVSNTNATASDAAGAAKKATDDVVSKDTFLQLLVAQIKHQDPLSPADGVQFLTQLAQFSELEQLVNIGSDIGEIRQSLSSDNGTTENNAAPK